MIRRLKKIELKTRAALAIAMLVFSCSLGEDGNNQEGASIELPHGTLLSVPTQAAVVPTAETNEVISVFSNVYSNVNVDTFLTSWSAASLETVSIDDTPTLKYSQCDFAAIETVAEQINAVAKTHIHFDYWTKNTSSFQFKLVDFGANGRYDGVGQADDVEHEITLSAPTLGEWVSVDLPLSDFTNLTTRAHLSQYIITTQPSGEAEFYLDNLYFYGDNGTEVNTDTAATTDEAGSQGGGEASGSAVDTSNMSLVWSDEFDYDGRPDTSKWHHQTYAPNGGSWFNGELQHYVNNQQTTYVSEGSLKIVARKENYTTQNVTKNYTSARLNSKYDFQYGRVDVRAKLPSGGGTWPAIWTLGSNINEAGNYLGNQNGSVGWPACGEIDIMEQNGWDKTQTYGYFHWGDTQTGGYANAGTSTYIADSSSEYHLYSLLWTEEVMQILLDGEVFMELPNNPNNPYDNPHYLLMNIAVGGNLGGEVPSTFGTQVMEVDYVRVYQ